MPKPKSKKELLDLSQYNFEKLVKLVNSYSGEEIEKEFPEGTLNRNIRDVLTHLHHWHLLMLDWYKVGMKGEKPMMPAEGYTWKTTPDLNRSIWEKYQNTTVDEALKLLNDSHVKVRDIIIHHSNEELFEKKRYKWTGTTSLGAYLISNTSSHYDWAFKLIRKSIK